MCDCLFVHETTRRPAKIRRILLERTEMVVLATPAMTKSSSPDSCGTLFECGFALGRDVLRLLFDWAGISTFVKSFHEPVVAGIVLALLFFVLFATVVAVGAYVLEWKRESEATQLKLAKLKLAESRYNAQIAALQLPKRKSK